MFKFKRIDLYAGTDLVVPSASTSGYPDMRSNSEVMVKSLVNALISSNSGWVLDSERNSTVEDFFNIPTSNSSYSWPSLFLKNTISGCRLFVAHCSGIGSMKPSFNINNIVYRYTGTSISTTSYRTEGFIFSMIPEGEEREFGTDVTLETFLPDTATRLIGTSFCYSSSTQPVATSSTLSATGHLAYGIFSTPYCVAVSHGYTDTDSRLSLGIPELAVGRVFGVLFNESDTLITSRYGALYFTWINSRETSTTTFTYSRNYLSASITFFGESFPSSWANLNVSAGRVCGGQIFKANGEIINYSADNFVNFIIPNELIFSSVIQTTEDKKTLWSPILCYSASTDPTTYGVVPGNGLKGYLDTDLFRVAPSAYGSLYEEGKFICVRESAGILVGWDSSNTDSIE